MFVSLELIAESYKHLLTAVAILVVVGGLWLTFVQLRRNYNFQRETVAKTTYREYLKLCVAKPLLASGKVMKSSLGWDEYTWFVSFLLWACDEVVAYAPDDKVWLENLRTELGYHRTYLASKEFEPERKLYTQPVLTLIDEVIGSGPADEPKRTEPPKAEPSKVAETPKTEPAKDAAKA